MDIAYVSTEQELLEYLNQKKLHEIRNIASLFGYSNEVSVFGLKDKIVNSMTVLANIYDVAIFIQTDPAIYAGKIPQNVTNLTEWRDRCMERLALNEPVLYAALGHWQLSLF